tara:strand:- start:183 stop:413 length:231 start_codon:yes stop_codon:yes gene_type:complete
MKPARNLQEKGKKLSRPYNKTPEKIPTQDTNETMAKEQHANFKSVKLLPNQWRLGLDPNKATTNEVPCMYACCSID